MKKLIIRPAVAADAGALADIHCRAWSAAYGGLLPAQAIAEVNAGRPEQWRRRLTEENPDYWPYAAQTGDQVVGLMVLCRCRKEEDSGVGEIGSIYIDPDFQHRGIGTRMLDFGVKELQNRGFRRILLWVLSGNVNARRFYEKNGFQPDGVQQEHMIGIPVLELRYQWYLPA